MAQLLVRNLDDDVKSKLQDRARRHGRSTAEEVREILRNAVRDDASDQMPLGQAIRALFSEVGFKKGEIREWRGHPLRPAEFE